jgi:L-lactate dehydrogenase complex protein LldE
MDVVRHAKALIGQLKNVQLVELQRETECCGFGGTFAVKQPAISAAMVRDKMDDIAQTGAKTFVVGDCGCLMNITGAMDHAGMALAGKHLAEFLWERTNGR